AVRDVAAAQSEPAAAGVDRHRTFPEDGLRALAETGALGLLVPPEHGGSGAGLAALVEARSAVGRACASTGMVFLMHSVTAATVAAGGGPGTSLRRLASGE